MKTRSAFRAVCRKTLLSASAAVALFAATPAFAQTAADLNARLGRVEQDIQRLRGQTPGAAAVPATPAPDQTDLSNRILALERAVEQLTGLVEESRFKTERMSGQLDVMTDDISLRLATVEQSLGITPAAPPPRVSAPTAPTPTAPPRAALQGAASGPPVAPNLDPDAPLSAPVGVAPRQSAPAPLSVPPPAAAATAPADGGVNGAGQFVMRTDAGGKPLAADPHAAVAPPPVAVPTGPAPVPKAAPAAPGPSSNSLALAAPTDVRLPDGTPKAQYDFAFNYLKQNDYPRAQVALKSFLKAHPKDPLAGNAQYWLGETYYVRGDYQQAAQEFMSGYQSYPKTNKGPDNLLKLGMSLDKLNQKDGACTAWSRIAKDYPDADAAVLKSASSERQKLKCK